MHKCVYCLRLRVNHYIQLSLESLLQPPVIPGSDEDCGELLVAMLAGGPCCIKLSGLKF